MTRELAENARLAAEASVVRPVTMVHLAFDSDPVFVNSSDRTFTWGGNEYLGVGLLGTVSVIQETSALQASGIRLTMAGIPADMVQTVLAQEYQGRVVTVYMGFLGERYTLVGDPILQWTGFIDQMGINLDQTATVVLTAENKLIRWEQPRIRRYTDNDQQGRFPGDRGCEFIPQVVEKEVLWGRTRTR